MTTIFDYLTVSGFLIAGLAFLILTERDVRTLVRVLISGIVFAIANQVGNHGLTTLGIIFMAGAAAFAAFAIRAGLSSSTQ